MMHFRYKWHRKKWRFFTGIAHDLKPRVETRSVQLVHRLVEGGKVEPDACRNVLV